MPINYYATNGATFSTTSTTSTWSSWCTGDAGTTSSTGTVWNTWVSTAATSATTTEWPSTSANVWKHLAYADIICLIIRKMRKLGMRLVDYDEPPDYCSPTIMEFEERKGISNDHAAEISQRRLGKSK